CLYYGVSSFRLRVPRGRARVRPAPSAPRLPRGLNPRLGDGGGLLFGGGAEVEVDLVELGGKQIESLLRRVGEVKQVQVGWRDHAPLGQRLKVDDLLPVGAPIEQDHDPFAEF